MSWIEFDLLCFERLAEGVGMDSQIGAGDDDLNWSSPIGSRPSAESENLTSDNRAHQHMIKPECCSVLGIKLVHEFTRVVGSKWFPSVLVGTSWTTTCGTTFTLSKLHMTLSACTHLFDRCNQSNLDCCFPVRVECLLWPTAQCSC